MKILFLDIDGVMVTEKSVRGYHDAERFLPSCVDKLDDVIRRTGAKVVVTNSCKIGDNVSNIQRIFRKNGLKNSRSIIGVTEKKSEFNSNKGKEIKEWMKLVSQVDNFVVIDDNPVPEFADNQIQVSYVDGFASVNVNEIVRKLR